MNSLNLNSILKKTYREFPQKKAIIDTELGIELNYQELDLKISQFSRFFSDNGIEPSYHVLVYLNNSADYIITFYSLLNIGAIPVLIDHRFCEYEIRQCMLLTDSAMMITDTLHLENKTGLINDENLKLYVFSKNPDYNSHKNIIYFQQDLINSIPSIENSRIDERPYGSVILITYRGYGYPLPVVMNEQALLAGINHNREFVTTEFVTGLLLPISHIFALTCNILTPLSIGCTVVIIQSLKPGQIINLMNTCKISLILIVPTLIKVLLYTLKKNKLKLIFLKRCIVGAAHCSEEMVSEWKKSTDCLLNVGFGLTETCPVIANRGPYYRFGSIGKPMLDVQAKITDTDGQELPAGLNGRLWIKTDSLMSGYYRKKRLTARLCKNGWFDTGDICRRDADGYYYFVRPAKRIIKIGGSTIDLKEIRQIIKKHPDVIKVRISIINDELWGHSLICKVTAKNQLTAGHLYEYCRKYLAAYKLPKKIVVLLQDNS